MIFVIVFAMLGTGQLSGVRLVAAALLGLVAQPALAKTRVAATKAAAGTTLTFDATCTAGRRAVIAAVGDLLFHDALQAQALKPGGSFRPFFAPIASVLADADLTYGNLESPVAEGVRAGGYAHKDPGRVLDRVVYGRKSDALIFNTHPSVAADLAAVGFDVLSTANNHAADRGALGMARTLDALNAAGLAHTGVRPSSEVLAATRWSTRTTTKNGVTVAWLACTYGLNGMPDPKAQVLNCYRDRATIFDEIRSLASDPAIDAVMLTPHWGREGAPTAQLADRAYARDALEAGATAVIGSHPHVLQPWEKYVSRDGREGLIVYSTGNFISNQQSEDQRTGMIALIEVTKPNDGAPARLSAAGYVPTFVEMANGANHRVVELKTVNASVKRLPEGNRVVLSGYRALPRVCSPPVVVAPHPPAMVTTVPQRKLVSKRTSTTQQPCSGGGLRGRDASCRTHRAKPSSQGTLAVNTSTPPPPERQPTRNDPVRAGRIRLDALDALSTPELVSARRLWHVPPKLVSREQDQWIAPPQTPAALPLRPSSSPSVSSRSKSRPTRPLRVLRSTPTRSNRLSTLRRR